MADVDFEEQNWQVPRRFDNDKKSGSAITNLILKTGLVKDAKQANYVLIGIVVLFIAITFYIFRSAMGGGGEAPADLDSTANASNQNL
ncbi:MAG TPA: hypothetical protein VJI33_01365 [Candidatus Paceibacterota bacterium]